MTLRYSGLLFLVLGWFCVVSAMAATINVVNGADSGPGCNLRDAIRSANADAARGDCTAGSGADTIRLVPSASYLSSALPTIDTTITIESATSNLAAVIGDGHYRIFDVNQGNLILNHILLRGGSLNGIAADGGAGIRVRDGFLHLNDTTVRDNTLHSTSGGGAGLLARDSTVTIDNSTIVDNSIRYVQPPDTTPEGPGIRAIDSTITINGSFIKGNANHAGNSSNSFDDSDLTVENSVLSFLSNDWADEIIDLENGSSATFINSTEYADIYFDHGNGHGNFLVNDSSLSFINSTILADHVRADSSGSVHFSNTIFSGDCYNISVDAAPANFFTEDSCTGVASAGELWLLPAEHNGGPTVTIALGPRSDAIDSGANSTCPATDQRGVPRDDGACDLGAFEFVANADIQISAVPITAGPYYAGEDIQLDINIYNAGPDPANFVRADATFTNLSINATSGACTSLPCEIYEIAPGAFRTISVEATVANGPSTFGATATAYKGPDAHYTELAEGNNVSSITRDIVDVADLSIDKTLTTPFPYHLGQSITHRIVVHNNGPQPATNVVVTETPGNLTITRISNCTGPTAGPCSIAYLAVGASATLDVTSTIDSAHFWNAAEVAAETADTNLGNNIDDLGNGGSAQTDADLKLSLVRETTGPYYNGKVVDYRINIYNVGPDLATNVTLNVDFSNFLLFGVTGNCGSQVLPCNVGTLNPDEYAEIVVQGQTLYSGPVSFHAVGEGDQTDADLGNNEDTDQFTAKESADIAVGLSLLTPPPYYLGQVLHYRMQTTNLGFDDASDVVLEISPTNLDVGSIIGGQCLELPCEIPILALLETETIEIFATPLGVGSFDMTASTYGNVNQVDWMPSNNVDDQGNGGEAVLDPDEVIFSDSFEAGTP